MRWLLALVLAAWCFSPGEARACSYGPQARHDIDPTEKAVDSTPPSALGKTTYSRRGTGPEKNGCGSETATSCDDVASLSVYLGEVSDDRTALEQMGYRVEVVAGKAPSDPTWPSDPIRVADGTLYLHWVDGDTDDQEAVDFTLRIRAVDLAGNEGPPSDVRIHDDGSSSGCRVAPNGLDVSWAFVVALLAALALSSSSSRRARASCR